MTMNSNPLKHPSLLTASDWGLYASDMDCTRAVESLNAALMNACMATNPNAFRHVMRTTMTRWSEYGSFDGDAVRLVDRYYDGVSARFELAAMKPPVSLSADDWQLYTASMDCTLAVAELNLALARGIKARSEDDFQAGMDAVCRKFAGYGASDPEALRLVERYRKAAFTPMPFAAVSPWNDQVAAKPVAGVEGGLPGAGVSADSHQASTAQRANRKPRL